MQKRLRQIEASLSIERRKIINFLGISTPTLTEVYQIKMKKIQGWAIEFGEYIQKASTWEGQKFKTFLFSDKLKIENDKIVEPELYSENFKKLLTEIIIFHESRLSEFVIYYNKINLFTSMDLIESKEFRSTIQVLENKITLLKNHFKRIIEGEKVDLKLFTQQPNNDDSINKNSDLIIWKKANDSLIYLFQKLGEAGFLTNDQAVSHTLISQHFCQKNGDPMNTNSMAVAKNKYSQLPGATPKNGYKIKEIVEQTVHKNEKRTTTKS